MLVRGLPLVVGLLAVTLVGAPGTLLLEARHNYTEQELLERIEREPDPVRKAKYQIELARLKLEQAIQAYAKDNVEQGHSLLAAYLDEMKDSWQTLEKSGRPAAKKPQGFRELDIALREDGRLLDDLKRRTPYSDRTPVEKIADAADKLHDEVLRALFPALKNRTSENHLMGSPSGVS